MTVQCVKCKKTWDDGKEDKHPDGRLSHGLCKDCARELLIPTVRKKQLREGNFDCFGKAIHTCSQTGCKYIMVCVQE